MRRMPRTALTTAFALMVGGIGGWAAAQDRYPPVDLLLESSTTTIGQSIAYPTEGRPEMTAAIVTMQAGDVTGWHRHDVPMFAWIMQGGITVDYGPAGTRAYSEGDALLEAFQTPHAGRATADGSTRILVVFAGSSAADNTVMLAQSGD